MEIENVERSERLVRSLGSKRGTSREDKDDAEDEAAHGGTLRDTGTDSSTDCHCASGAKRRQAHGQNSIAIGSRLDYNRLAWLLPFRARRGFSLFSQPGAP